MTGLGAALANENNPLTLLLDLSPASTFIAYFHNCFRPKAVHFRVLDDLQESLRAEYDSWYLTPHTGWPASVEAPKDWQTLNEKRRGKGRTKFVVWSTIVACPECGYTASLWDLCVNLLKNTSADVFECSSCKAVLVKERKYVKKHSGHLVQPVMESFHDLQLGKPIKRIKRVPVLVSYEVGGTRYEKAPSREDMDNIRLAETKRTTQWCPVERMPEGDESRRNDEGGITHSHHFFPARTLHVLASASEASPQFHKKLNSCKNPCGSEGETRTAGERVCRKDAATKTGSSDERNSKGSWTRSSAARSMRNAWPR
jgi:hypothetical protein